MHLGEAAPAATLSRRPVVWPSAGGRSTAQRIIEASGSRSRSSPQPHEHLGSGPRSPSRGLPERTDSPAEQFAQRVPLAFRSLTVSQGAGLAKRFHHQLSPKQLVAQARPLANPNLNLFESPKHSSLVVASHEQRFDRPCHHGSMCVGNPFRLQERGKVLFIHNSVASARYKSPVPPVSGLGARRPCRSSHIQASMKRSDRAWPGTLCVKLYLFDIPCKYGLKRYRRMKGASSSGCISINVSWLGKCCMKFHGSSGLHADGDVGGEDQPFFHRPALHEFHAPRAIFSPRLSRRTRSDRSARAARRTRGPGRGQPFRVAPRKISPTVRLPSIAANTRSCAGLIGRARSG